jgi:hypothetical protein
MQKPTEVDLDTALALLEYRTRQNCDQRDRIDDGLWSCLSDLAAVHDFQSRLELLRSAQDRTDAIELLKDPDMRHLNHRTVLRSHARRIADDEFKDFSVSGFDNRCKALREFLKVARLEARNEPTGKDRSQATLAMHTFWKTMRENRSMVLDYAAKKPGGEWAVKHAEADLRVLSIGERSRLSWEILETSMGELDTSQEKDPELGNNLFGISPMKR